MIRSILFLSLLTLLVVAAVPPRRASLSTLPVAKDCFSGKWGNDYVLCGDEHTGKSGKGNKQKRSDEELVLQFKGKDKGEFTFYNCQDKKRFDDGVPFSYELAVGDLIRFIWEGTPDQILANRAAFNFRDTYHYTCKGDTLIIHDNLLSSTSYRGTSYFVRR